MKQRQTKSPVAVEGLSEVEEAARKHATEIRDSFERARETLNRTLLALGGAILAGLGQLAGNGALTLHPAPAASVVALTTAFASILTGTAYLFWSYRATARRRNFSNSEVNIDIKGKDASGNPFKLTLGESSTAHKTDESNPSVNPKAERLEKERNPEAERLVKEKIALLVRRELDDQFLLKEAGPSRLFLLCQFVLWTGSVGAYTFVLLRVLGIL